MVTAVIFVCENLEDSFLRIIRSVRLSLPPDTATATWSVGENIFQ